jgi:hypothetical protein
MTKLEPVLYIAAVLAIAGLVSAWIYTGLPKEDPAPADTEDPAIPPARVFEPIPTTTREILEPLPLPEVKPELPDGVICLDDCPLIEAQVIQTFGTSSTMVAVARCESGMRHYDTDGTVLMNREGSSATGIFQLMASYHAEPAQNLGWDIRTPEGNIAYAHHLYQREGLQPWEASAYCWRV